MTKNNTIDISQLSLRQLEELMAKKKKEEDRKTQKEKLKYEKERDAIIDELILEAQQVSGAMQRFKAKAALFMEKQQVKLSEYGKIRSNSKGGFSIMDTNGLYKITRRLDTEPSWDERAHKGVELIQSFLFDTVKKKDLEMFELLLSFLVKNKKGELEYSQVFRMMQHENLYSDERWIEGLRLLKEGYQIYYKGFGYEFKYKLAGEKWENIVLSFSSL